MEECTTTYEVLLPPKNRTLEYDQASRCHYQLQEIQRRGEHIEHQQN